MKINHRRSRDPRGSQPRFVVVHQFEATGFPVLVRHLHSRRPQTAEVPAELFSKSPGLTPPGSGHGFRVGVREVQEDGNA
jgi:hypothetical protein